MKKKLIDNLIDNITEKIIPQTEIIFKEIIITIIPKEILHIEDHLLHQDHTLLEDLLVTHPIQDQVLVGLVKEVDLNKIS